MTPTLVLCCVLAAGADLAPAETAAPAAEARAREETTLAGLEIFVGTPEIAQRLHGRATRGRSDESIPHRRKTELEWDLPGVRLVARYDSRVGDEWRLVRISVAQHGEGRRHGEPCTGRGACLGDDVTTAVRLYEPRFERTPGGEFRVQHFPDGSLSIYEVEPQAGGGVDLVWPGNDVLTFMVDAEDRVIAMEVSGRCE
jgi:hypothetical protein